MSTVIWCTLQNDPEDTCPDDLGYILEQLDDLDQVCGDHKVKLLSSFVDESDIQFNLSEEALDEQWLVEHACWFEPQDLLASVNALLKSDEFEDEINDGLTSIQERCIAAIASNTKVRLLGVL